MEYKSSIFGEHKLLDSQNNSESDIINYQDTYSSYFGTDKFKWRIDFSRCSKRKSLFPK